MSWTVPFVFLLGLNFDFSFVPNFESILFSVLYPFQKCLGFERIKASHLIHWNVRRIIFSLTLTHFLSSFFTFLLTHVAKPYIEITLRIMEEKNTFLNFKNYVNLMVTRLLEDNYYCMGQLMTMLLAIIPEVEMLKASSVLWSCLEKLLWWICWQKAEIPCWCEWRAKGCSCPRMYFSRDLNSKISVAIN